MHNTLVLHFLKISLCQYKISFDTLEPDLSYHYFNCFKAFFFNFEHFYVKIRTIYLRSTTSTCAKYFNEITVIKDKRCDISC